MRAVRFAAQLGYAIEPATLAAIPCSLPVTRKVSVERIAEELSRLLVASAARTGLELLRTTGLLGVALPVLAALPADRLAHTFQVVDRIDPDLTRRFAAALHLLPAAEAERAVLGLRLPVKLAGEVRALLAQAPCLLDHPVELPPDAPALRRWLARVEPDRLAALLALRRADAQALPGPGSAEALARLSTLEGDADRELQGRPPLTISDLAIDGRAVMVELGVGPGRHVGAALRHLMDRALDDPGCNTREALAEELRAWWAQRRL
jgi:tRNA nucleotidyltransferase (CCA-adding enzyme)